MTSGQGFGRTVGVALLVSLVLWTMLAVEHHWRIYAPIDPSHTLHVPYEAVLAHASHVGNRSNVVNDFIQEIVLYWRVGN